LFAINEFVAGVTWHVKEEGARRVSESRFLG